MRGSEQVEAQARRYLVWFPALLRATRGEEAVALVLDLLPPDSGSLSWRSKLDLVRAGVHARRVALPPISVWFAVVHAQPRSRSGSVPPSWRPWLGDRLQRRAFAVWIGVLRLVPLGLLWFSMARTPGPGMLAFDAMWALGIVVSMVWWLVISRRGWRAALFARNALAPDGSMLPPREVREVVWPPRCANASAEVLATCLGVSASVYVVAGAVAARGASPDPLWATLVAAGSAAATLLVLAPGLARAVRSERDLDLFAAGEAIDRRKVRLYVGAALAGQAVPALLANVLDGDARVLAGLVVAVVGGVVAIASGRIRRARGAGVGLWELVGTTGPQRMYATPPTDLLGRPRGPRPMVG